MEQQTTRILIADDHPLVRGALRQAVANAVAGADIVECGSLDEAIKALDANPEVDLILLDLAMPGVRGYSGLMMLRSQYPSAPIVVVSAREERNVIRLCLDFGASGFIPKSTDMETMQAAIRTVLAGDVWAPPDVDLNAPMDREAAENVRRLASLTPQQARVLMMLSEGLLNKQIAYELSVSEATVKAHVSAILQKLGVESRTQAVIAAARIEAMTDLSADAHGD